MTADWVWAEWSRTLEKWQVIIVAESSPSPTFHKELINTYVVWASVSVPLLSY